MLQPNPPSPRKKLQTPAKPCAWLVLALCLYPPKAVEGRPNLLEHTFSRLRSHARLSSHFLQTRGHPQRQAESTITPITGTTRNISTFPAPRNNLGRNVVVYLKRAAVARSLLIGSVVYNFAEGHGKSQDALHEVQGTMGDSSSALSSLAPLRVAQYSQVYSRAWKGNFSECDRPCEAAGDLGNASAAAVADVVFINMMSPQAPWTRPPGQIWVGTYFESPDHYPYLKDAATLAKFNYTMGYRPDADFPVLSMVRDTAVFVNVTLTWPVPNHALKRRRPMMSTWISNCVFDKTGRMNLLAELARRNVTLSSYGSCGPGLEKPQLGPDLDPRWRDWGAKNGRGPEKAAVSAQHLFMYAAENSGCAYYITEKVFHALVAGSVPLYVGDAASLKKLAPPNSVIYAADFASSAALAAHLHYLAANASAYEAYLAWRADPAALDSLHTFMSFPTWEAKPGSRRACALCEFLWAAPRRRQPPVPTDLCKPVASLRMRL